MSIKLTKHKAPDLINFNC